MRQFVIGLLLFSSSSSVIAAVCCNTPTVWTFKNNTKAAVALTCELESSPAWTADTKVRATTPAIAPNGTYAHNWGADWYSDGMGMIPGKWSCNETNATTKKPVQFATDWGENITVNWNGVETKIAKSEETPAAKAAKN